MTSSRRNAFTLFEVILVLIILVVMAAIAFPTLDSMIYSRRLLQSTERLQNELHEARVEAMRTGQVQVFRATINGNSYSIGPWLSGNEDSDASAGATVMNAGGIGRGHFISTSNLPRRIFYNRADCLGRFARSKDGFAVTRGYGQIRVNSIASRRCFIDPTGGTGSGRARRVLK